MRTDSPPSEATNLVLAVMSGMAPHIWSIFSVIEDDEKIRIQGLAQHARGGAVMPFMLEKKRGMDDG